MLNFLLGAAAEAVNLLANVDADRLGMISRQFTLQTRCRAKMVKQIGMRTTDPSGNRLQGNRLRTSLHQYVTRSLQRRKAAGLR